MSSLSQQQKIITLMCKRRDKIWFLPADFMDPDLDYLFVGYEASARFSELAKANPKMIETKQHGKYKMRRICWETMDSWFSGLSKDLRYAFHRAGATKDFKQRQQSEPTPVALIQPSVQTQPTLLDVEPDKPKRQIML